MSSSARQAGRGRTDTALTPGERRTALALAGIVGVRMLGLFLILPVFSVYAVELEGATLPLIGLALGIYGLTQALLQVPFGLLSDRVGRKPVIVAGLLLFVAGSAVAALADTIWGVVAGRVLQGSGAVAAAVMALAADLSREEHRTKVMATIGVGIGLAFMVAMVAGPVLGRLAGLAGIFWITAGLALAALVLLLAVVPTPVRQTVHRDAETVPAQLGGVLRDAQLWRLNFGVFTLHLVLTASFLVVPRILHQDLGVSETGQSLLYLGVFAASVVLMVPFVVLGERHRRLKEVMAGAVMVLGLTLLGLARLEAPGLWTLAGLMVAFFAAFNLVEALLPSLVAKIAPTAAKGTAMGVFSTCQFLGAFAGGAAGGRLLAAWGPAGVFAGGAAVTGLWLLLVLTMRRPAYLSSQVVRLAPLPAAEAPAVAARLQAVAGVAEAVVVPEEGVAYLKVDRARLEPARLEALVRELAAGVTVSA